MKSFARFSNSTYFQNDVKFIFISTATKTATRLLDLDQFFYYIGALNYIIMFYESLWIPSTFNQFSGLGETFHLSQVDPCSLFPNKLEDLHGYTFNYALVNQPPRCEFQGELIIGIDDCVLAEIRKSQNAEDLVTFYLFDVQPERKEKHLLREVLNNRDVDLSLNTIYFRHELPYRRFINTYDTNGFCIVVPFPPRISFFHVLITPFDKYAWLVMCIAIVACAVLWKLLSRGVNTYDSPWYFTFGVFAFLLNQSIPFRKSRRLQKMLMQLCILMTFIFGNIYQSLIISSIASSAEGIRLKSLEELLNSEVELLVFPAFTEDEDATDEFTSLLRDRFEIGYEAPDFVKIAEQNLAVIARCDLLHTEMNIAVNSTLPRYFYMMQEKISPYFEMFVLADRSPFYESLQHYHDLIFESGIRQYWWEQLKFREVSKFHREAEYYEKEMFYLHLDDLQGCFIILFVGTGLALLIFVLELTANSCKKSFARFKSKQNIKQHFVYLNLHTKILNVFRRARKL